MRQRRVLAVLLSTAVSAACGSSRAVGPYRDAPVILMGADKLRRHGWVARHTSEEAVRLAARRQIVE